MDTVRLVIELNAINVVDITWYGGDVLRQGAIQMKRSHLSTLSPDAKSPNHSLLTDNDKPFVASVAHNARCVAVYRVVPGEKQAMEMTKHGKP